MGLGVAVQSLSHLQLFVTPGTAAHHNPLSSTISQKNESYRPKIEASADLHFFWIFHVIHCCCLVARSCLTLCHLLYCSPPGSSVHGDSPGRNTEVDCHALLCGIFPDPGIKALSPALQLESLPLSHQGSPFMHSRTKHSEP